MTSLLSPSRAFHHLQRPCHALASVPEALTSFTDCVRDHDWIRCEDFRECPGSSRVLRRYANVYVSVSQANLVFKDIGELAWRFQIASAFLPAVPLAIGIYFCPESPRWLMKKHRYAKAWRSFCRLRNSELQAARDMILVWAQLREEASIIKPAPYLVRIKELFTIPRVRRATLASFIVMLGQQVRVQLASDL